MNFALMMTQPAAFRLVSNRLLLLIMLAGFSLRLYRIDAQSLWYDETVSAFLAGQPVPDLIAHTARDIHPPGYYLLLRLWSLAAGNSEFSLAFFSLIFGLLLIPLIFRLALSLLRDHQVATWAALLAAISPFNIWYSQEVRMYTLGAALGLLTVYWAVKAFTAEPGRARVYWSGYLIAASLGLYTLYYFVFLLIILNLFLLGYSLWPRRRAAQLKALFLSNGLILAAYLPWLPAAWRQATNPPVPPWRARPDLWTVILESWSALSLGQSVEPASVWPVLVLTLLAAVLGVRHIERTTPARPYSRSLLLLSYSFGPLLLLYLLSFLSPLYHVRYLFTYSPAFYILLGAGLAWLGWRANFWIALAAPALLIIAAGFSIYQLHFEPRYRADDYRAAVSFIQDHWQPGDVILVNAGYTYTAFLYYAGAAENLQRRRLLPYESPQPDGQPLLLQTGTVGGDAQLGWGDPRSDFYAMAEQETLAALEQLSADYARLWMLRAYDTVTDPDGLIRAWLAENAILLEDQLFSGPSNIRAQGFLLHSPSPPEQQTVLFEDGMGLAGWQLPDRTWQAGQTISLKLWWTATGRPGVDYKMSLKMWAPTGELAAQGQDQWPVGTLYRTSGWPVGEVVYQPVEFELPPDLPSGQYWLNVELYHPETIQPLPRQDTGETVVTLGPVTIDPT